MLLLGSIRSIMRGCIANSIFRKPTRPSLPLRKAPHLSPSLSLARRERMKPPSGARNRYALRLAGHQSPSPSCAGWDSLSTTCFWSSPSCAGWDRLITTCFWSSPSCASWDRRGWEVYNLQFIINSLLFRANSL